MMVFSNQLWLVFLSVFAVATAGMAAVAMSLRAEHAMASARRMWTAGATMALAMGIWSVHFIGVLALELPNVASFEVDLAVFSFLAAMASSGCILLVGPHGHRSRWSRLAAPLLASLGMLLTHHWAMLALAVTPRPSPSIGDMLLFVAVAFGFGLLMLRILIWSVDRSAQHRLDAEALGARNLGLEETNRSLTADLAREQSIFEAAVDATNDVIFSWSPTSDNVSFSHHSQSLLGINQEAAPDTMAEFAARVHPADWATLGRSMALTAQGHQEAVAESIRLRDRHFAWRWVLIRGRMMSVRLGEEGSLLIGAISDIAAQKASEEGVKDLARRRQEVADFRGRIIRILSHELRTPLSVLTTGAELLQASTKPIESAMASRVDTYFQNLHGSVDRIQQIITEALQYNQLESGEFKSNPCSFSAREWIDRLTTWVCAAEGRSPDDVVVSGGASTFVWADPIWADLVLRNLLSNALKYGDGQPVVVEITHDEVRRQVVIEVCDRGIGIPVETQPQLFRPYSRGQNVGAIKGTGLGLSLAHLAAIACGGELRLVSSSRDGTRFRCRLPAER